MNCPFCQKKMRMTPKSSPSWQECDQHRQAIVYVKELAPLIMQMSIGNDKWLSWEADGSFVIDDHAAENDEVPLFELDYHPKIKPEEAQEFLERVMKMKAFT